MRKEISNDRRVVKLTENQEQIRFVETVKAMGYRVIAIPNGGKRTLAAGYNLKRMGMAAGAPDVLVPYPTGKYHGFFCELKIKKGGVVTDLQFDWIRYLNGEGYFACIANGHQEAIDMFIAYLNPLHTAA